MQAENAPAETSLEFLLGGEHAAPMNASRLPHPISPSPESETTPPGNLGASTLTRRQFLCGSAVMAVAAPWVLTAAENRGPRVLGANEKLQHACIGTAGMGWGDLQSFLKHKRLEVVALCDVDENNLNNAAKLVPQARLYRDWREMLRKEGTKVDSVNVTVPDHMHFPIAFSAIQSGKHVYCQKPMCHDIAEVRALTEAASRRGVMTQLGTQMAAGLHDRTAVQWMQEGRVGKVTHVYLCANRPGAVEAYRLLGPRPATGQAPPRNLDWDLWIGTAPMRPFAPEIYHPVKWRAWLDFGTGWSGDIGCHIFDAVWKGLDLKPALTAHSEVQESWKNSPARRADTWPQGDHITWTFAGNKLTDGKELPIEWYDGDYFPPEEIRKLYSQDLKEYPGECAMVVGTEGALLNPLGYPPQLLPEEKFKDVKRPELPPRDHYLHFVDACLGGEKSASHFGQTGPMTETILLGTVAVRVPNMKLEWDHTAMKVANNPEANKYLKRRYREGWSVGGF